VSSPTAEANQRIREEQQAKILEAARKVFAQKGSDATMADIAVAATVSQGLVYHYFPSKQVLVHEIVKQALNIGVARAQPWLEAPGTPDFAHGCSAKALVRPLGSLWRSADERDG
jgi:AcrR family transcriptional regulator